jgi:hypothetical protein
MKEMMPGSDVDCQVDYARKLRLLTTTNWPTAKIVWTMQGYKLVNKIKPTSSRREATVILSIISEIRQKLAVNFLDCPFFESYTGVALEERAASSMTYLVVGSPLATSLAETMSKLGIETKAVAVQEWRVNSCNVNMLEEKTRVAMKDCKLSTVILVGLENSIYQAQTKDGYSMPIRKTIAGD